MAELTRTAVEVLEVWEQGTIGQGRIVHGLFSLDDEAGARACYERVLARTPWLAQQGALGIARQRVDVLAPANSSPATNLPAEANSAGARNSPEAEKMRRAGRDYEDKALEARR